MGVQWDVPRDCRTFKLYASVCGVSCCCVCVFLLLEELYHKSRCNIAGLNCYVQFCKCALFYWARTFQSYCTVIFRGTSKYIVDLHVLTHFLSYRRMVLLVFFRMLLHCGNGEERRRGISECHSGHAINFRSSMTMQIFPQESVTGLIFTFELDLKKNFLNVYHYHTDPMAPKSD